MSGELIGASRALRRKRISLDELRRCWLELHPEQLQHPERDALLLAALEEHAGTGGLALPAPASYEQRGGVTICAPCDPPRVDLLKTTHSTVTNLAVESALDLRMTTQKDIVLNMSDIYDAQDYEPTKAIGHLLGRVRAELIDLIDRELTADEHLASVKPSSAHLIVLNALNTKSPRFSGDLCRELSYDAGAMTRMLHRLEQKGLLRRRSSPFDRRVINLELTEKGEDAIPRLRGPAIRAINRLLKGFTETEARQLERLLARMLDNSHGGA